MEDNSSQINFLPPNKKELFSLLMPSITAMLQRALLIFYNYITLFIVALQFYYHKRNKLATSCRCLLVLIEGYQVRSQVSGIQCYGGGYPKAWYFSHFIISIPSPQNIPSQTLQTPLTFQLTAWGCSHFSECYESKTI